MIQVLFVDDEEDLLHLFKAKLAQEMSEGSVIISTVSCARDCLAFLETHKECQEILVVSDINMPEMDGLALLRVIQKKFPQVKVYISSGHDTPFFRSNSRSKGALRFFAKPLNFKEMSIAVREDFHEFFRRAKISKRESL